jgi:hypothetical protein
MRRERERIKPLTYFLLFALCACFGAFAGWVYASATP